jgi:hypothetical protein
MTVDVVDMWQAIHNSEINVDVEAIYATGS